MRDASPEIRNTMNYSSYSRIISNNFIKKKIAKYSLQKNMAPCSHMFHPKYNSKSCIMGNV